MMDRKEFARQNQFDYLYSAITNKYPGLALDGEASAFQFMEMPMEAAWVTGTDEAAFNLADTVPAKLGGFYSAGAARVSLGYGSLLKSLMGAMADNNKSYRDLQSKMDSQAKLIDVAIDNAKKQYGVWRSEQKQLGLEPASSLMDWLEKDMTAAACKAEYDRQLSEYNRYKKEAENIYGAMGAALAEARQNLDSDQMLIEAGVQGGRFVPRTTIGGNLQQDIMRWKSNPDSFDLDVVIKNTEQSITPWKTVSTTEVKQSCHSTKIDSKINVSRIIMDKAYSLRFKAVGMRGYPITRGAWYNDTFVRPSVELPRGCQLNTDSFFGADGSLHLIPTSILVLYQPQIELTVSTACYKDELENKTNLGLEYLELFGIRFSLEASLKLGHQIDSEVVTQTFVTPDNAPAQILGVTSAVRYSGFQGW